MTVDPLAEIIALLQPQIRLSKLVECSGPWKIRREGTGDPFYCAVLEGRCRLTVDGQQPMLLEKADFILVPALRTITCESLDAPQVASVKEPTKIAEGHFRVGPKDAPAELTMRIGHCHFASADAELLVQLLPHVLLARGEHRLTTLMELVSDETLTRRPARDIVLGRLLELLFIEALRGTGETSSAPSLARGLADETLSAALRALHARPEHPWTVVELAEQAALSRSAFFNRFNRIVGLPPMGYLLAWRMALAKRLLQERELGIEQVAERVGYGSASTFSIAFRRYTGLTPARYGRVQKTPP